MLQVTMALQFSQSVADPHLAVKVRGSVVDRGLRDQVHELRLRDRLEEFAHIDNPCYGATARWVIAFVELDIEVSHRPCRMNRGGLGTIGKFELQRNMSSLLIVQRFTFEDSDGYSDLRQSHGIPYTVSRKRSQRSIYVYPL